LLGLRAAAPEVFDSIWFWPYDLRMEYLNATTPKQRAIVGLRGLQRLRANGKIDENPNAVHTKIPQLAKLLKEKNV
jgi:hypothetical protein